MIDLDKCQKKSPQT